MGRRAAHSFREALALRRLKVDQHLRTAIATMLQLLVLRLTPIME